MRLLLALMLAGGAHSAAVHVTLTAPTHAPAVGTKWRYVVRATERGKPAAARITAQIVDPIGNAHAVTYANTSQPIVKRPFHGTFRDFVTWPASARGIPLTFRITVLVGRVRKVLTYAVTARQ
jgi:hypothetical protein